MNKINAFRLSTILANFLALWSGQVYADTKEVLSSPDGTIEVRIVHDNELSYSVFVDDRAVISASEIDLQVRSKKSFNDDVQITNITRNSVQQTLMPEVRVKSATIEDHYNEATLNFSNNTSVSFRAYDNGVAYRFETSYEHPITIDYEVAEFNFSQEATAYYPEEESLYSHNERSYIHYSMPDIDENKLASTPTLIDNRGVKVLITETGLRDYAGLWLIGNGKDGLIAKFPHLPSKVIPEVGPWVDRNEPVVKRHNYLAKTNGTRHFPWRIMAIARNDGELLTNQLSYQLAEPNRISDTSWIKPGKVAWDWYNANNIFGVDFEAGLNTETYKYYIDFAAENGLEYVILDEGWYQLGDLMSNVDGYDVPEIIRYGKEKGVGIILWTTWLTLRDQFDEAMDRFAELGAVGIKPDFFQRDDQEMVNFYWKIADEAAKRKLLVDFHGSYKPAGLRRTYPNVISREGVKGLEWNKWSEESTPEHNTTLPFIRMVAGPMDYTPGAMSNAVGPAVFKQWNYSGKDSNHQDFTIRFNRPMSQTTRVHQMAMLTVFESPLQMMADSPSRYRQEQECATFMSKVPTVWDETVVLHGKIGDYVSVARKHGDEWFIGTLNDEHGRDLSLSLDFLEPNQTYQIEYFQDGANAHKFAEDYKKVIRKVTHKDNLTMHLAPAGGFTAHITKL